MLGYLKMKNCQSLRQSIHKKKEEEEDKICNNSSFEDVEKFVDENIEAIDYNS